MDWWWSWLLAGIGIVGIRLAGKRDWRGWAVGLGVQGLWLVYAILTSQYGFIASCAVYGGVYWKNMQEWRTDRPIDEGGS